MNATTKAHTLLDEMKLELKRRKRGTIHSILLSLFGVTVTAILGIKSFQAGGGIFSALILSIFVLIFIGSAIWDVVDYFKFKKEWGF